MKLFKEWQEHEEELDELLSIAARKKIGRRASRMKGRIARGKKIAQRKMAPRGKLEQRAMRAARNVLTKKLSGGKGKSELNVVQRVAISKKLSSRSSAIKRLSKRLFVSVSKAERQRLKDFRSSKGDK